MMANVFEYLTTETRRTPSVKHKRDYFCVLCASVVKILFEPKTYET
jgi:hypothetical protein